MKQPLNFYTHVHLDLIQFSYLYLHNTFKICVYEVEVRTQNSCDLNSDDIIYILQRLWPVIKSYQILFLIII